ncbi:YgiQ family radical SAM protein [Desulfurivibrio alkaliphilus]|uniref:Radical SAM domain protein n=1 Tax=Desulfurivibrio alkaliphilus (strain DSM 19089 / UNIQEM U267 / AHT2) TaxID=589865 RepID=D6Z0N8_DESAT|nr:YgiQ family radical SAM protein [Desulfurivibrio alkaliphilus]ADH85267.1 Radical SAM domain protein [Desulfurivibrio alkaliphilus AHT 2]
MRKNATPGSKLPLLPATASEMHQRGWETVDVVLVSGDAYIDHPSFGLALIGRWLEAHGYRVAILAQPRYDRPDDFLRFGRPRLFFGISAGNLDSIVANYTGNVKVRDRDDYSPDGNPYFGGQAQRRFRRRPDRATIIYAQQARRACGQVPIILGGLEASLRRFVHYDYQQRKLRASVLTDAKADLLVYGMGERAVLEVARRLEAGEHLHGIAGTCERLTPAQLVARGYDESMPARASAPDPERAGPAHFKVLPGYEQIMVDKSHFLAAEREIDRQARARQPAMLLQRQQAQWLLQHPPAAPLRPEELDRLYALPYARRPHPQAGRVPAFTMVRDSVTIVRGCCGNCAFCAITRHQGGRVVSRSRESIIAEVAQIAQAPDFRGTITDLGGPTANLYGCSCSRRKEGCSRRDCLYPDVCRELRIDEDTLLELLQAAAAVAGVRHLLVSSGLRMELLLKTPRLLRRLLEHHTPGTLKIAPEHTEPEVLRLMHKPDGSVLEKFVQTFNRLAAELARRSEKKPPTLNPYLISAHPGCTMAHMEEMVRKLQKLNLVPRQFQDFTPTPGTLATAIYVSGLDPASGRPVHVPKGDQERRRQRLVLEQVTKSSAKPGRAARPASRRKAPATKPKR